MAMLFEDGGDKLEGFVDRGENGWVFGWAWRLDLPNEPIRVDLYVDGKREFSSTASLYRPDLESAGKGNGRHAFEIQLPGQCWDEQTHVIQIRYHGTTLDLCGSPQSVSLGRKFIAADDSKPQMTWPAFHSRFGGLWTDLSNARDVIEGKAQLGWISVREAELLKQWIDKGFVILPHAVSPELIEELDREVEDIWSGRSSVRCFVEAHENGTPMIYPAGPSFKNRRIKLLDLYFQLESARKVVFAPSVLRFLNLIFERPAVAFQSLYFLWGSQQAVHQDTAFVKVSSPMEFAASWIALEDIQLGSGELEYYIGSHRLDEYLFEGRAKWMPIKSQESESYLSGLHQRSESRGLKRETFCAGKGDALIWNADLAHGGSHQVTQGLTRKSIVTHYCPGDCWPIYSEDGKTRERIKYSDLAYYSSQQRD